MHEKDMFDVPAEVLIEFGLQLCKLLLSFPHVLLKLQARLPCIVVASGQSAAMTHLITYTQNGGVDCILFSL